MPKGVRLKPGINDLRTLYPDLAEQVLGVDPSQLYATSKSHVEWKCDLGHQWTAQVAKRTVRGQGCPFCSNNRVWKGFNDLETENPDIAAEAFGWDPSTVGSGYGKKVQWKCPENHVYEASVIQRTFKGKEVKRKGSGCPYCNGSKVWTGFNDVESRFPEVAKEADGWDPSVVHFGRHEKRSWKCTKGHKWEAQVYSRTHGGRGCPYCANYYVWKGFNDLLSQQPELAKEANGWDPAEYVTGSQSRMSWKCDQGHEWKARIVARTLSGNGCPTCAGLRLNPGLNDLKTKFPLVAAEADGWDPSQITYMSGEKRAWICSKGHKWEAVVSSRSSGNGCPVCAGKVIVRGQNDLQTLFPEVARRAVGWDPGEVSPFLQEDRLFMCDLGHKFEAQVATQSVRKTFCRVCDGTLLLTGFNDLLTRYPQIAKDADGWDPSQVVGNQSQKKFPWVCECGCKWVTTLAARVGGHGCPSCSPRGYDPEKDAWFYLMIRPGEQQFGITNQLKDRMSHHSRNGWTEMEVVGPSPGRQVLDTETMFKKWLKSQVGCVPGTSENWFTSDFEVSSLKELKERSGVETDLF